MLLGMLEFLLFYESTKVIKDVSLIHGYRNGKHEGYRYEGSLCRAFLLFRNNTEYSCYFVFLKERQCDEETCGDESGNVWGFLGGCEELFDFNIYHTPVISISLASKQSMQNSPILLVIIVLPLTVASSVLYLLLFCSLGSLSRSIFAVLLAPFLKWVILNYIAHGSFI